MLPLYLTNNIKNKKAVDLCAAPGGKTFQLLNYGAKVKAVDKNKQKASKECRKKAISMIESANAHSQKMGVQAGATEVLTIDLMRRAGMFEQALKLVEETKTKDIEEIILQIIAYEEALIESKDIDSV